MFQVTIGSLGLIAFVWGPLANGGIRMDTHEQGGRQPHVFVCSVYEGLMEDPYIHSIIS